MLVNRGEALNLWVAAEEAGRELCKRGRRGCSYPRVPMARLSSRPTIRYLAPKSSPSMRSAGDVVRGLIAVKASGGAGKTRSRRHRSGFDFSHRAPASFRPGRWRRYSRAAVVRIEDPMTEGEHAVARAREKPARIHVRPADACNRRRPSPSTGVPDYSGGGVTRSMRVRSRRERGRRLSRLIVENHGDILF